MAKVSFTGPASVAAPVHGRTSANAVPSEVVVIGTDGSDAVLDPATLAGPDTIYRGVAGVTIALAAGERLHSVLVVPTALGQVTVTVPGNVADQCPVDFPYDADFKGGIVAGSLVIAGAVAYYRVMTFTP